MSVSMMAAILIVTMEIIVSNDSSDWCKFFTTTAFLFRARIIGVEESCVDVAVCSVAPTPL